MSEQQIPESRSYQHVQCNNETEVSGDPFEVVSNPMSSMEQTYCSTCEAMFPITDFEWADTGEKISDYYARHSSDATDRQRFLCSKKFMVTLIAIGAILTTAGFYYLVIDDDFSTKAICVFTGLVVGAVIGSNVHERVFENPIKRKVCKVSDPRLLT